MINKQYYERVVKYHNITAKKYENALKHPNGSGGYWYRVGDALPWFFWGWIIGTIIAGYFIFRVCYWVLSAFFSAGFGCAPDNPVLAAFITLGLTIWLIRMALFGIDKNNKVR